MERVALPLGRAPALPVGEIHAWVVQVDELPVLIGDRSGGRRARLRRRRMRQRFVLRLLLGAYLGRPGREVAIRRDGNGKPRLAGDDAGADLSFNLSHARGWLVIGLTRGMPVGVDIECSDRTMRRAALARRWLDAGEADWLESLGPDRARQEFLRIWTAREAVVKAAGESLARSIGALAGAPGAPERLVRVPAGWPAPERWSLHELTDWPALCGWIAALGPLQRVRRFELALPGQSGD